MLEIHFFRKNLVSNVKLAARLFKKSNWQLAGILGRGSNTSDGQKEKRAIHLSTLIIYPYYFSKHYF
jgi:hypothetical protein